MNKGFWFATALLAGTIIGAGIFSLPYVISRVGVLTGFFYLGGFALVYFLIHLMYARVLELDKGNHQFFYVARRYLKEPWASLASFLMLSELVLVLAVYLILAPNFIGLFTRLNFLGALFVFWFVGSVFVFAKLNFLAGAELLGTVGILLIVFLIFLAGGTAAVEAPKFRDLDLTLFLLPFGPLLFSLAGRPAIHKVVEEHRSAILRGKDFSLNRVIFWGTVLPALVYFLFVLGVLRLNPAVGPETITSLDSLSPELLAILGVLGFITLWTSYFMIGANVKDILRFDLKWSPIASAVFVLGLPLGLYFAGLENFFTAVSLTGGVFLALEGILVITIWRKAFKESRWRNLVLPLYLVFLAAVFHEIASLW